MANVILTGALVLVTAFYAWATYRILKANERVVEVMHEQAAAITRPYVTITPFLELDNPIFYLRISNIGKTAAKDLKLSMNKPFYEFGDKKEESNLSQRHIFKNIIKSFPPGAEIIFPLAQSFIIFSEKAKNDVVPSSFVVTAEYSYADKCVKETNEIDLRAYLGAGIPQNAYVRKLKSINDSIENIAKKLKNKS